MITLGIETSCDETSVGIIDENFNILANVIISQIDIHQTFGGVVPEIAARNHIENILPVLDQALAQANLSLSDVQQIAATTHPGLPGAVMVGRVFGKSLANALHLPFIGVNHLHGHMATLKLSNHNLSLPMLCLLVSGGHTVLYLVDENWTTKMLFTTADDAIGEAFDKVARVLGMPYPGGPQIAKVANMNLTFQPLITHFPKQCFSYSGLKTAVLNYINHAQQKGQALNVPEICANFQYCAIKQILDKTMDFAQKYQIKNIGICGGVSANRYLREQFTKACQTNGLNLFMPKPDLCGDNAAMIAAAAVLNIK